MKVQVLKRVFQENKAHQIFRKTTISYLPPDMYMDVRFSKHLGCYSFMKHAF